MSTEITEPLVNADYEQMLKLYLAALVLVQHLPRQSKYVVQTERFSLLTREYLRHQWRAIVREWCGTRREWFDINIETGATTAENALFQLKKYLESELA